MTLITPVLARFSLVNFVQVVSVLGTSSWQSLASVGSSSCCCHASRVHLQPSSSLKLRFAFHKCIIMERASFVCLTSKTHLFQFLKAGGY